MKQAIDLDRIAQRAKGMTTTALSWSRMDAIEAAEAADALERAGCRVSKTGGDYRDEATIYAAELKRRGALVS